MLPGDDNLLICNDLTIFPEDGEIYSGKIIASRDPDIFLGMPYGQLFDQFT
jgi:hypothetical protein